MVFVRSQMQQTWNEIKRKKIERGMNSGQVHLIKCYAIIFMMLTFFTCFGAFCSKNLLFWMGVCWLLTLCLIYISIHIKNETESSSFCCGSNRLVRFFFYLLATCNLIVCVRSFSKLFADSKKCRQKAFQRFAKWAQQLCLNYRKWYDNVVAVAGVFFPFGLHCISLVLSWIILLSAIK